MAVRVAVLGLGAFGRYIAEALYHEGCEVLGVDQDAKLVQALKDTVSQTATADVGDRELLHTLGVHEVDIAVVAMADSVDTGILLVQHLAKLEVPQIVASANSEEHAEALGSVGATRVCFPERDAAQRLARHIVRPNVLDYVPLEEGYSIIDLVVPKAFVGKTIMELQIRQKYGLAVLAVQQPEAEPDAEPDARTVLAHSPAADFRFEAGQCMLLYGADTALERIRDVT